MTKSMCYETGIKADPSTEFSPMRLMSSQNEADVEALKEELLKAGILSETRRNVVAEALGVTGVELWVNDERDFCEASRLYEEMQGRAPEPSEAPAATPPTEAADVKTGTDPVDIENPAGEQPEIEDLPTEPREDKVPAADEPTNKDCGHPEAEANGARSSQANEPCREQLKQANSVLEKGIEAMFQRERALAAECASLRGKVAELSKALIQEQASLVHETESRAVAEKNQAEQISGLLSALERERAEWEQELQSRDDLLKQTQGKLEAISQSLQDQQAAAAALKEEMVSLELQRDEFEKSLVEARTEAVTEREARMAAEERAEKAALEQKSLEKRLVRHKELEQQMRAYVASLSSLCGRMDPKAVPDVLSSTDTTVTAAMLA